MILFCSKYQGYVTETVKTAPELCVQIRPGMENRSIFINTSNIFERKVLEKEDKALPENASTTADPDDLR